MGEARRGPIGGRFMSGALITVGALAVFDNVVFHWILEFHRFKTDWPGSVWVEVVVVAVGAVMVVVGIRRELAAWRDAL